MHRYTVKDVVEVCVNRKLAPSTLIHHICVCLGYCHVIAVISTVLYI